MELRCHIDPLNGDDETGDATELRPFKTWKRASQWIKDVDDGIKLIGNNLHYFNVHVMNDMPSDEIIDTKGLPINKVTGWMKKSRSISDGLSINKDQLVTKMNFIGDVLFNLAKNFPVDSSVANLDLKAEIGRISTDAYTLATHIRRGKYGGLR